MRNLTGYTVNGKYHILAELGRGKDTIVYKAWQKRLQRFVALKVLKRPSDEALRRFQKEMRFVAHVQNKPVRRVYEVGRSSEGFIYAALEYVDYSLRQIIDERKGKRELFTRYEVARYLKPVAEVLDYLHDLGWVHLDVKPENILVFKDGRVVLADFGIVQRKGAHTHDCTPLYASPEQAAGDRPVGPWSDIYSLGVVAYEMLAGRPPFISEIEIAVLQQHLEEPPPSIRRFNRKVSLATDHAVRKALEKDPSRRYQRASYLTKALERKETPIITTITSVASDVISTTPKPLVYITAAVLLVASLGVGGLIFRREGGAITPTPCPTPSLTSIFPVETEVTLSPTPIPIAPTATLIPTPSSTPTFTPSPTPTVTPTVTFTPVTPEQKMTPSKTFFEK